MRDDCGSLLISDVGRDTNGISLHLLWNLWRNPKVRSVVVPRVDIFDRVAANALEKKKR